MMMMNPTRKAERLGLPPTIDVAGWSPRQRAAQPRLRTEYIPPSLTLGCSKRTPTLCCSLWGIWIPEPQKVRPGA